MSLANIGRRLVAWPRTLSVVGVGKLFSCPTGRAFGEHKVDAVSRGVDSHGVRGMLLDGGTQQRGEGGILGVISEGEKMRYLVLIVLAAIVLIWLIQKAYHDSEAEKAVEETTDYLTGKTPINILIRETINTRKIEIQQAVRYFEGVNGRPPKSLDELIEQGFASEGYKFIKYGNIKYDIISGLTQEGRFFVQGIGPDQKKGTQDDWREVF